MVAYFVRKAEEGDMPRIAEIYACARAFLAANGNPTQWGTDRPPLAQLERDIAAGDLYVITDEQTIHGVFAFLLGDDPTYAVIYDGAWHFDKPYGTLHRVAGDGSGGIFSTAVAFAKQRSSYLRIDTHENNRVMQHVIAKAGFQRCGMIITDDGTPRIAYDYLAERAKVWKIKH